jgi:hypothetical protein
LERDSEIIRMLQEQGASCIIRRNGEIILEEGIGVKPLMKYLREDRAFFRGASVADKVIGKAAAMLLAASGAGMVYGEVMSDAAADLLAAQGIAFSCGKRVRYIHNRTNTGMCPLEEAVQSIDDPQLAFDRVEARITELMAK